MIGFAKTARFRNPLALFNIAFAVLAIAAATMFGGNVHFVRSATSVDLVLILALDVSTSVDEREFALQRDGLAQAFRNPVIIEAISRSGAGQIAVTVIQWAGHKQQSIALPWTIIRGSSSARRFAVQLTKMRRHYEQGETSITGVIRFAAQLALSAPFTSGRRVIDLSGDGEDNVDYRPQLARDDAIRQGITINALAILDETDDLDVYFRDRVIGGTGAFVMAARTFTDYPTSILKKLHREVSINFLT